MFIINDIQWKVEFTNLHNPILEEHLGLCDNTTKIIYLADNLKGFMLKKVLCHEIVHAAMFSYNVSLSYEQEEIIADIIATYGNEIIDITNKVFKKLQSI